MYADDANIFVTGNNLDEAYTKLDSLISLLVNWVDNNGLALNLKKTKYMVFSRQRNLQYRDVVISGIDIENLTWAQHISAVKMKMSRYVGLMYISSKNIYL